MAEDKIRRYQEALRELEVATRNVEKYVATITDVSEKLQNWDRVVISNVGDIGFPPEAHVKSINADDWFTAIQLAEALSNWHKVCHEVRNAWNAIPSENRMGLQPPES